MNTFTKLALAFLAGVVAMALDMYLAGIKWAAPMFLAGMLSVAVPVLVLVSSAQRMRSVARFLNGFAAGLESRGELKPPPLPQIISDPLRDDVIAALRGQGVKAKVAAECAAQAIKVNRTFDAAFRAAIALVPKAA